MKKLKKFDEWAVDNIGSVLLLAFIVLSIAFVASCFILTISLQHL